MAPGSELFPHLCIVTLIVIQNKIAEDPAMHGAMLVTTISRSIIVDRRSKILQPSTATLVAHTSLVLSSNQQGAISTAFCLYVSDKTSIEVDGWVYFGIRISVIP